MTLVRRYAAMPLSVILGVTFACAITSPSQGASLTTGAPTVITGTISGAAVTVQVYKGGTLLGSASITGQTWAYSWTPGGGDTGAQTLTATATAANSATASAQGVAVTVASSGPSGTDYGALAVANGLTVVGYFRADSGVTGSSGTGKASWAPLAGAMSAITPDGTATNGIGSVTAGLNGRAGLKLDGSTQMGSYTAPALAAPGTTNWHRYWIARQASAGVSGAAREIFTETGNLYMVQFASATQLYAYGTTSNGQVVTNDIWQRGWQSVTGSTTGELKIGNLAVGTGGSGAINSAPATGRKFGNLLLNLEFLMYLELTGTQANFHTFAAAADTDARTDWTTAIQV